MGVGTGGRGFAGSGRRFVGEEGREVEVEERRLGGSTARTRPHKLVCSDPPEAAALAAVLAAVLAIAN